MLKIKLEALNHPTPDKVNYNDRRVFASTILWLEDQKVRHYRIEDREGLRKVDQLKLWEVAYLHYKTELEMPEYKTPLEELSWLLSYAVRLEFLDEPEKYSGINAEEISQKNSKSAAPTIKADNFFDNLDFSSKEFTAGVRGMANKQKMAHHPNHLIQLEAIARIDRERLSPEGRKRAPVMGTPFPFERGNDVVAKDNALDLPVRVLRLLQLQSLRELQTNINETIVAVQNLTANPKTDTKLGKVGF